MHENVINTKRTTSLKLNKILLVICTLTIVFASPFFYYEYKKYLNCTHAQELEDANWEEKFQRYKMTITEKDRQNWAFSVFNFDHRTLEDEYELEHPKSYSYCENWD